MCPCCEWCGRLLRRREESMAPAFRSFTPPSVSHIHEPRTTWQVRIRGGVPRPGLMKGTGPCGQGKEVRAGGTSYTFPKVRSISLSLSLPPLFLFMSSLSPIWNIPHPLSLQASPFKSVILEVARALFIKHIAEPATLLVEAPPPPRAEPQTGACRPDSLQP